MLEGNWPMKLIYALRVGLAEWLIGKALNAFPPKSEEGLDYARAIMPYVEKHTMRGFLALHRPPKSS